MAPEARLRPPQGVEGVPLSTFRHAKQVAMRAQEERRREQEAASVGGGADSMASRIAQRRLGRASFSPQ